MTTTLTTISTGELSGQVLTTKVAGRIFNVMAMFHNNRSGEDKANAYMERTPGASVLGVTTTRIYLVHKDDKGRPE